MKKLFAAASLMAVVLLFPGGASAGQFWGDGNWWVHCPESVYFTLPFTQPDEYFCIADYHPIDGWETDGMLRADFSTAFSHIDMQAVGVFYCRYGNGLSIKYQSPWDYSNCDQPAAWPGWVRCAPTL
jgi:hypothetical protein